MAKRSQLPYSRTYNLLVLLGQSMALLGSSITQGFKDARVESQQPEISNKAAKEAYTTLSKGIRDS